jgi:hypothetical protein
MAYPAPRVLKLQSSRLNSSFDYRGSCGCDSGRLLFFFKTLDVMAPGVWTCPLARRAALATARIVQAK